MRGLLPGAAAWLSGLLLAALPAAVNAAETAPSSLQLDLRAYLNFEAERQTTDAGRGDPRGSFDMDVAELVVMARRGALRGSIALDLEHGSDTERGFGTVDLGFGFLEYALSNAIRLRAGKILNPFGFYNEFHTVKSEYPTVKEASSTLKPFRLSADGFRYAPKWEVGLSALGTVSLGDGAVDYVVTVANGENIALGAGQPDAYDTNPYDVDNNVNKSVTARVRYSPVDGVSAGASFYRAGLTEEVTPGVSQDGSLLSFGAFAHYNGGNWAVLAEVNHGRLEPTSGGAAVTELGWVASVGYRIDERWMPFGQLERIATERGGAEDWGVAGVVGLNLTLADGLLIKLEYDQFRGSAGNARLGVLPHRGYGELKGALVGAF